MNHYQKLGVFSFRLAGVLQIFFGFISALYVTFTQKYGTGDLYIIAGPVLFGVIFSLPGIVMILFSRKLGRFVGRNLEH